MTTIQTNNAVPDDVLKSMNGTKKSTSDVDAAQDRFMTLLVTQMKNQDPLNPMDNAQITGQLAQLSTVNGINKLNTTLEALKGSYQSSQTLQATSMIGHGVLVPGSTASLSEGKAIFGVELTEPADSLRVTVKNAAGVVMHQMDLGSTEAGVLPLTWDGKTDTGAAAPDGTYKIEVDAKRGGVASKADALSFGQVMSVTTNTSGVKLNVPGLGALDMTNVRQIL